MLATDRRGFFGVLAAVLAWRPTRRISPPPPREPVYALLATLPTADEARPFQIDTDDGVLSGTVPSNRSGVTAIRIYRS